jgi:phosphoribosylanthranilate isomerase
MGVTPEGEMVGEEPGAPHLVLLDTSYGNQAGGSGRTWPWEVARGLTARRDVMMAGGLSGANVAQAIRALRPFGVDASSALELSPGIKDPERVLQFVTAARESDAQPDPPPKDPS